MNNAALIAHVVSGAVWVGAVFMASFIDWPAAKACAKGGDFPFDFVVDHGRRILPAVYSAIALLVATSALLVWLKRPTGALAWGLVGAKALAFSFMVGSTVYGTIVAWPRLQFSTHTEAYEIYGSYITRARAVFLCGVTCIVLGLILAHVV